jgi:LmbE family N-acetylglucosaminyl deacetylase
MLPNPKPLILGEGKNPPNMRWIYISPHFDDVVLSCGGLIWEQTHSGIPVEIWTVMAGDPPAGPGSELIERMHAIWKTGTPQETVALRRIEDQNATRHVGATVRHLNCVDAIYRRTNTGSLMYPTTVLDSIHPRDESTVEEAVRQIGAGLTQYDTVACPMAIGGHVDHIFTRKATEMLNRPLWYYADVPYLLNHRDELAPATTHMTGKTFFISPQGLAAWVESIAAYASQITSLFDDVPDMRQKIKEYAREGNGLTLWERE